MFEIVNSINSFSQHYQKIRTLTDIEELSKTGTNVLLNLTKKSKIGARIELLSARHEAVKQKYPGYGEFINMSSTGLTTALKVITRRQTGQMIGGAVTVAALTVGTGGIFGMAAMGASLVGYGVSVTRNVMRQREVEKVKTEADNLERLVRAKKKSIAIGDRLNIDLKLATEIGLSSVKTQVHSHDNPLHHSDTPLSKLERPKLLAAITAIDPKTASAENLTIRTTLLARLSQYDKNFSAQKNKEGRTSMGKSYLKHLGDNWPGYAATILGVIPTIANPVAATFLAVNTLASAAGGGFIRSMESNSKQDAKNAISAFRLRPDVPGYESLKILQNQTREIELQSKAMKILSKNPEFTAKLEELKSADPKKAAEIKTDLAKMVKEAKFQSVLRQQARSSEPIKKLDKEFTKIRNQEKAKITGDKKTIGEIRKDAQTQAISTIVNQFFDLHVANADKTAEHKKQLEQLFSKKMLGEELTNDAQKIHLTSKDGKTTIETSLVKLTEDIKLRAAIEQLTNKIAKDKIEEKTETAAQSHQFAGAKTYSELRKEHLNEEHKKLDQKITATGADKDRLVSGMIDKYVEQDKQTFWQKTKTICRQIGDNFNPFSKKGLTIEDPHKLIQSPELKEYAISARHEHTKELEPHKAVYQELSHKLHVTRDSLTEGAADMAMVASALTSDVHTIVETGAYAAASLVASGVAFFRNRNGIKEHEANDIMKALSTTLPQDAHDSIVAPESPHVAHKSGNLER